MTALEFKNVYMKPEFVESATVLAIIDLPDGGLSYWHVHNEEELPEDNGVVISTKWCDQLNDMDVIKCKEFRPLTTCQQSIDSGQNPPFRRAYYKTDKWLYAHF